MVVIEIGKIIEALQYKVRGVVKQAGAFMAAHVFQEALVRYPVVQVFTGMDFIA